MFLFYNKMYLTYLLAFFTHTMYKILVWLTKCICCVCIELVMVRKGSWGSDEVRTQTKNEDISAQLRIKFHEMGLGIFFSTKFILLFCHIISFHIIGFPTHSQIQKNSGLQPFQQKFTYTKYQICVCEALYYIL